MKKFMAGVVAGAVLSSGAAYAASLTVDTASFSIYAGGKEETMGEKQVLVHNGAAYVPVRDFSKATGHQVYWDGMHSAISIDKPYVHIVDAKGKRIGHAVLTEEKEGVKVEVEVQGLKPGKHGFHVHEKAFVKNDFKSAGGHFNPDNKKHGLENPEGHHVADMPNLEVKEDGTGKAEFMVNRANLKPGDAHSILGKAIIIHADEDDMKSDPAGNAGDRVAGGNIPQ
ncbi:superoxide dismutase family protein [Aneurinibacillus sp. REN35]|uniref:superoxide dismutase family protein n=1 Tax=Aneurinibacillus sp. REN35 TaxID=3237286 RepID=UPI0035270709